MSSSYSARNKTIYFIGSNLYSIVERVSRSYLISQGEVQFLTPWWRDGRKNGYSINNSRRRLSRESIKRRKEEKRGGGGGAKSYYIAVGGLYNPEGNNEQHTHMHTLEFSTREKFPTFQFSTFIALILDVRCVLEIFLYSPSFDCVTIQFIWFCTNDSGFKTQFIKTPTRFEVYMGII